MVPDRHHGGYRRVILATVGCLIGLWSWGIRAEPVNRTPVAKPSQAVEAKPDRQADRKQERVAKPTWPPTTVDAEQASKAECGTPQECRAEQRDYSDLRAQWQAAEAAKGQETFARYQTYIAAGATILAGIGTIFLIWTFRETKRAADAAAQANRVSFRAYLDDQRPWLTLKVEIAGDLVWIAKGLALPLRFVLENIGRTPALDVQPHVEARAYLRLPNLSEAQLVIDDRARRETRRDGFTVFPDQTRERQVAALVPLSSIAFIGNPYGRTDNLDEVQFRIVVIGCVSYRPRVSGVIYRTGFIYAAHETGDDKSLGLFRRGAGDIPKEQLQLHERDGGGLVC